MDACSLGFVASRKDTERAIESNTERAIEIEAGWTLAVGAGWTLAEISLAAKIKVSTLMIRLCLRRALAEKNSGVADPSPNSAAPSLRRALLVGLAAKAVGILGKSRILQSPQILIRRISQSCLRVCRTDGQRISQSCLRVCRTDGQRI
jgi:hypothetical protein